MSKSRTYSAAEHSAALKDAILEMDTIFHALEQMQAQASSFTEGVLETIMLALAQHGKEQALRASTTLDAVRSADVKAS